jgi:hypothetical protein
LLLELMDNVEISYRKWDYLSCVWKIFCLIDNLIIYEFRRKYKIDTKKDFDKLRNMWIEIHKNHDNWVDEYAEIWSLREKLIADKHFSTIFNQILIIYELKKIRNKSIIAHDFWWISQNNLNSIYYKRKKYSLIQVLSTIKTEFPSSSQNIFEILNEEILEKIRNL